MMTTVTDAPPAPGRAIGVALAPGRLAEIMDSRPMSRQEVADAITALAIAGHPDALPFAHRRAVVSAQPGGAFQVRYWDAEQARDMFRTFRSEPAAYAFKARADAGLPEHEVIPTPDGRTCTYCGAPAAGGLSADAVAKIANGTRKPKPRSLRALCAVLGCTMADLRSSGEPAEVPLTRDQVTRRNTAMRGFADAIGRTDLYRRPDERIRYTALLLRLYEEWTAAGSPPPAEWYDGLHAGQLAS